MDYEIIFSRQHEHYRRNKEIWQRSLAAYSGGADYIREALVKHVSEIDLEYVERLERACYFNYPRKIARLITQYILAVEPQRENADLELAEDFSRTGLRANEVMRQFATLLTIYGGAAMLVEMPYFEGEIDPARKKSEKIRPAARAVSPLEIPDWAYGADGELEWIIVEEESTLDNGPFNAGIKVKRRKLWTRNEYFVFEKARNGEVKLLVSGAHKLGRVPALYLDEPDGFGIQSRHYFEDVVKISEAILNNGSEAQMNIVKQMFGLLVISDSFARGARLNEKKGSDDGSQPKFSHLIARSAAIWESPEEKGISRYITPTGADIASIQQENLILKRELFDIVGMAVQNNSNHPATAESKSWDHHQVRQFLVSRADILEQAELQTWQIFRLYDRSILLPQVIYNRDFSVIDMARSVESLLQLREVSDGPGFRREIARTGLFLLEKLKKIDPETRKNILQEIEESAPGQSGETEAAK